MEHINQFTTGPNSAAIIRMKSRREVLLLYPDIVGIFRPLNFVDFQVNVGNYSGTKHSYHSYQGYNTWIVAMLETIMLS